MQPHILVVDKVEKAAVVTDEGSGRTPGWSGQNFHLTFEVTSLTNLDCAILKG